jgi:hypothetical protein
MTNTTTSHRLVNLRAHSAGCSCGATYEGDGSANLRTQHKAHKDNPQPANKATARKAAPKSAAKATSKPRARKAVAK